MRRSEIQTKINDLLSSFPEDSLNYVLEYLKALKNKPTETANASREFKRILEEDRELLKKLAK